MIDWLVGWLADLLAGWLVSWLVGWMINWLINWLVGCLTDWLIDIAINWLVGWLINWLVVWLIDWLINWLVGWLTWLVDWLIDWLIGWLIGWLVGWLIEWLILIVFVSWEVCVRNDSPYLAGEVQLNSGNFTRGFAAREFSRGLREVRLCRSLPAHKCRQLCRLSKTVLFCHSLSCCMMQRCVGKKFCVTSQWTGFFVNVLEGVNCSTV